MNISDLRKALQNKMDSGRKLDERQEELLRLISDDETIKRLEDIFEVKSDLRHIARSTIREWL